jgi:hypothetical protein
MMAKQFAIAEARRIVAKFPQIEQHVLRPALEMCIARALLNRALLNQKTDLQIENRGLRRRLHSVERHSQHFDRCESAWCHPGTDSNPALEMGEPDVWPFGGGKRQLPECTNPECPVGCPDSHCLDFDDKGKL